MKYIVEVNSKWLVSIEAESALSAKYKILDYQGVWGALAFDKKSVKTDTFLGAMQTCEMISIRELEQMVKQMTDAGVEKVKAIEAWKDATRNVAELEAMLALAKQKQNALDHDMSDAISKYDKAVEVIGKNWI